MKFIREHEQMTLAQLAELLEITPAAIAHVTSGRNKPGYELLAAIATKLPHYDLRWLLTGQGEPYVKQPQDSPSEPEFAIDTEDILASKQPEEKPAAVAAQTIPVVSEPELFDSLATEAHNEPRTKCQERLIICFPDNTFEEYTKR